MIKMHKSREHDCTKHNTHLATQKDH